MNPLLERVKFLAIVSSNIDEFFMKRIGGLKQQVGAGVQELTVDANAPAGPYTLYVGLYNVGDGQRLPVTLDGKPQVDNSLPLTTVEVR